MKTIIWIATTTEGTRKIEIPNPRRKKNTEAA